MNIRQMLKLMRDPRYVSRPQQTQVTNIEDQDSTLVQQNMYAPQPQPAKTLNPDALNAVSQEMYSNTPEANVQAGANPTMSPFSKKMKHLSQQNMKQKLDRPSLQQKKNPNLEGLDEYGFDRI